MTYLYYCAPKDEEAWTLQCGIVYVCNLTPHEAEMSSQRSLCLDELHEKAVDAADQIKEPLYSDRDVIQPFTPFRLCSFRLCSFRQGQGCILFQSPEWDHRQGTLE
jgi:hypothetical protein